MIRRITAETVNHSRFELSPTTAFAAAAFSAILLYLSFQLNNSSSPLAFIALIPLLAGATACQSPRTAAGLGLLSGFFFFYIELYWITNSIAGFTSLPTIVVILVMALLALYMSLYVAIFCGLWHYLNNHNALGSTYGKVISTLAGAAIWLLLEDFRGWFLGGFPWHPLGLTQIDNQFINWLLPLGGVRLLSSLVIFGNLAIYLTGRALFRKRLRAAMLYCGLLLLPLIGLALIGSGSDNVSILKSQITNPADPESCRSRIAVIQPNILQKEKWRPENRDKIIEKMLLLSRRSLADNPDLIVWPEAALPLLLENEPEIFNRLHRFVTDNRVSLMLGSPRLIRQENGSRKTLFNSIFLISPGQRLQIYNKIKLVPYGEFTPMASLFPFISKIVPGLSYSPGDEILNFNLKQLKIAPSVCFEGVFPAFSAGFFAAGANLLINLTNDAWFGDSPGPRQHLANIRLRAIENNCTIVRCANTGISAIINPAGKIEQYLPLNQEGILFAEITCRHQPPTFFARHRFLPTYLAGLYLLLTSAFIFYRRSGYRT